MMVTTRLMIKKNCDPNQAPTTVSTARLVLLVPPSPPLILHSGVLTKVILVTKVSIMMINIVQDGIVGPLNRGGDLSLKCKTEGGCIYHHHQHHYHYHYHHAGRPPPSLVWRKNAKTLNSSSQVPNKQSSFSILKHVKPFYSDLSGETRLIFANGHIVSSSIEKPFQSRSWIGGFHHHHDHHQL